MQHLFNTDQKGYDDYLANKPMIKTVKGDPQSTDTYTAVQLKAMKIFGVYKVSEGRSN